MYVTHEQLQKELGGVEERLHMGIDDTKMELRDFKSDMKVALAAQEERFDERLAGWLEIIRIDMENHRIIFIDEMKKESQLQRFYFQKDMEIMMEKQREKFNADITRHMTALGEEYQWRLATVGEKVDFTWEKCERKYVDLERKDMVLAEKVALLEEYLPMYPRYHKGTAQLSRKDEANKRLKSSTKTPKNKTKK